MTSLRFVMELPKKPLKPNIEKLEKETDKASVDKDANRECTNLRGQKRVKRWPSSKRNRIKKK